MRNRDNFTNSFDYIIKQLFPYNYNNSEHVHILKLKLWTLDAEPLQEELNAGFTDTNIKDPKNHKAALDNELFFLERYRKTQEGLLASHEIPFDKLVAQRIKSMENWVSRPDPVTGKPRPDYTMPYMMRPTLLTEDQFRELYLKYKEKEKAGQLSNCLEITSKITSDDINLDAKHQETAILNYKMPPESKRIMLEEAAKLKAKQDDDLVNEMDRAYSEIHSILSSCAPVPFSPSSSSSPSTYSDYSDSGSGSGPTTTITYSNISVVGLNFPSPREYISMKVNDPSHKGFIQDEVIHEGGYRFTGWNSTLSARVDLPSIYEIPDDWVISVNPYKIGMVEWDFNSFMFAHKYTVTVTTSSGAEGYSMDGGLGSVSTTYVVAAEGYSDTGDKWYDLMLSGMYAAAASCISASARGSNIYTEIEKAKQERPFAAEILNILASVPDLPGKISKAVSDNTHTSTSTDSEGNSTSTTTINYTKAAEDVFNSVKDQLVGDELKARISKQSDRIKELISRWYDFNEIRENKMRQTGLRVQIESLIDTEPEDVLDDMKHYFEVLKSEEDNVEDILVERCLFGEWK